MHQSGTFVDWTLEGLAAHDQTLATGTLVDNGSTHGLREVARTLGLTTRVDEADFAGVTVRDLPTTQVNGVVRRELAVDERVGLADLHGVVAAIVFGLLLLDDVGLDGDTLVVGLSGEVGAQVVVDVANLEGWIT